LRPGSEALLEVANTRFGQNVSLSELRVLVVEDDADSRSVLKRLITAGGAETREAALVDQALELIETFRPHVLVSDLGMPHRDGYDLIREVRARGYSHQALPAIALTAFARAEDRHRALLAGFQIYLVKPVNPLELTAAIASVTGRMSNSTIPQ
jgi:CheY-like chemotaxis protein